MTNLWIVNRSLYNLLRLTLKRNITCICMINVYNYDYVAYEIRFLVVDIYHRFEIYNYCI